MIVLVTGGLGNIGKEVIKELIKNNFKVRIFDLKTKKNIKTFKRLKNVEIYWGDITKKEDIEIALKDVDVVVHLAFIIPKISSTEIDIEKLPNIAEKINVGGTRNLIEVMEKLKKPKKIIFTSSVHTYGITQDRKPPLKITDDLNPNDIYSYHKVLCENMLKSSKLKYLILRLAASIKLDLKIENFVKGLFEVPLNNRIEFVHPKDIGIAIVNSIKRDDLWGKTLNIGGGERCQFYYKEMVSKILDAIGIGMLPEELFTRRYFAVDWMDTEESEKLLNYQKRDLNDYIKDIKKEIGFKRYVIKIFRHFVRIYLISKSPYVDLKKLIYEFFTSIISAIILIAISSGVFALISIPIGA